MKVTSLPIGGSLTIRKGGEAITWVRKDPNVSGCTFRCFHIRNGRVFKVLLNKCLGTSEDTELAFRLSQGFRVA